MRYIFKNRVLIALISTVDFIGHLLVSFIRPFWRKGPGNVGNILVIRLDHIGDMLCASMVAQNLKEHYHMAKVTFLTSNISKQVIINNPYVDEVICYDAPWFRRSGRKVFELVRFVRLAKELGKNRYDLGFDLRGDIRHILLMTLAGVRFRVGYDVTGGGFMLNRRIEYRDGAHSIDHNLDMLKGMGIDTKVVSPQIYTAPEDEKSIDALLEDNRVGKDEFIIILHPNAGYPSNRWMDERFAQLIDALSGRYKSKILMIGSENDKQKNESIIEMSKRPVIDLAGKTSLNGLIALIKRASLYIGVNSGPTHIAAATGVPVVALYSGTNRLEDWGPRGDNTLVIQKYIPCSYCEKTDCDHNICMDLITVDDALEAVEKVLSEKVLVGSSDIDTL